MRIGAPAPIQDFQPAPRVANHRLSTGLESLGSRLLPTIYAAGNGCPHLWQ